MVDIDIIRDNKKKIIDAIEKKCMKVEIFDGSVTKTGAANEFVDCLLEADRKRRTFTGRVNLLREERNKISNSIGHATAQEKPDLIFKAKQIKSELEKCEPELEGIERDFSDMMLRIPSVPADDAPCGNSESHNVELRRWGDIRKFNFQPRDHVELGE